MINPVTVAVVYAAVGSMVVMAMLKILGAHPKWVDVVGACVVGALASLIPTAGAAISLLVTLAVLYWRGAGEMRDIGIAVLVARLAMVPVLLALRLSH